jgi:putative flippase GtrA
MVPEKHRELFGQLVRFGLTGGLLTVLVAGGYWVLATPFHVEPMTSMTIAFLVVTGIGYVLHSNFSFRGHGGRDRAGARTVRFFIVNVLGFLANQFFVWLLVRQMHGPTWWPVIPILFATPLLTFALQRKWVFG